MSDGTYSIAVFPFLKTRDAVAIGEFNFRPTEDTTGLSPEQAKSVAEIASMLFLKDDLRIRSASYAVVPFVNLNSSSPEVTYLLNTQAVVAYLYASPHKIFGDLFLSSEHASMALFSPGRVSIHLVRPDFNVNPTQDRSDLSPDKAGNVPGYAGLYNFRHHFWVAPGSRLYGPEPHLTLNHAQNLSSDLMRAVDQRHDYRALLQLLRKPETAMSLRIFTAIRWFNTANREANDDAAAIVNLAIAFESLLGLPRTEKTDRLIDAIALLLGRIPRLDVWVRQFYDARSRVVHEGYAQQMHFIATDSHKDTEGQAYQPLLSYGRQIFQLCVGTLLVGSELAEEAGLEEKLVTNQERFERICKTLADEEIQPCDRLVHIDSLVNAVERYRFVYESSLKLESMISAGRLAAKALVACDVSLTHEVKQRLEALVAAKRSNDHFDELKALEALDQMFRDDATPTETQYRVITRRVLQVVWGYVFPHYFWLKRSRST